MDVIVLFEGTDYGVLKPLGVLHQRGEKMSFDVHDLRLVVLRPLCRFLLAYL